MLSDLGWEKILVIVLVLFLLFGPKKIPEIAQGLGKGIKEFKKALKDAQEDDKPAENKTIGTEVKEPEKKS